MELLAVFFASALCATQPAQDPAAPTAAAPAAPAQEEASSGALAKALAISEQYFSSPTPEEGISALELLERPLIINGQRLSAQEMKRFLIFGAGSSLLESAKYQVIIERELESRGLDEEQRKALEVTDEEFEYEVEKQRASFMLAYPSLDFPTEVSRAFRNLDLWKRHLRQTMHFDKIFLPDNPDEWPPVTTAAIIDESGGPMFYDDAKEVFQLRTDQMATEGTDRLPDYPMMYLEILRGMLLDSLHKFTPQTLFPDELGEGVIMAVDGEPIHIDPVFAQIAPFLTVKDVQDARFWITKVALVEQKLAAEGKLLSRAEWAEIWSKEDADNIYNNMRTNFIKKLPDPEEDVRNQKIADWEASYRREEKGYNRLLFDRQMLGLQAERFPSMWAYGEYMRLKKSFEGTIAKELEDELELRRVLDRTTKITSIAKVDSEMILISAFDFSNFKWRDNGWADAWERALEVRSELDAGGRWKEIQDLKSEFWDPPQPETDQQKPMLGFKYKGKWGSQTRNNLLSKTEESEFTNFLYGDPVADYAFFDLAVNEVVGPLRGPYGYYFAKLNRRNPPTRTLDLNEPRHFDLLQQYYLRDRFTKFGRELMEAGEVHGLMGPIADGVEIPD